MSVRRGKTFCESHVKLKQIKVPSTPTNKVTMRSFLHATDSNYDAVSFEFCNNTMNSPVCKNINNASNVNAFIELNDSLLTTQPNGSIAILAPKTIPATSKPRVPDILMINKYYGLIPQKFAISSRKPPGSTPTSAHGSRGTTKSSSSKPRAKSSTHHRHPEGRGFEKLKGCRSDNDSPEPIMIGVISRNGSLDHSNSTSEERSSDPFGPVTKKMSVEKYKKWKHSGGSKGRNVNMRSCSVEETLSLMEKGLPDGLDSHANRASAEYLATRRVIKIDLSKVSWDEENYQITTSINDNTVSNFVSEDEESKHMPNGTHATKPTLPCTKDKKVSSTNAENESITIANNFDNGYRPLRTKAEVVDTSSLVTSKDFLPEKMNMQSSTTSKKSNGESTNESFAPKKEHVTQTNKSHHPRSKTNFTPDDKFKDLAKEEINGNWEKASEDKKGGTMRLSGKLGGRTISFDEKILEGTCGTTTENLSSGRSDPSKKRPMTASVQHVNKTTTFQSPNNFNPPSKVIPWTQQSTTGGKPLTLAERRAKFQRTTSIHSSSSLSVEGGDEETSEVDNSTCIRLPTNSLAYRETRKPLHVIQAPEVTTLISQINPNADEDIQIEIEKVAIMLKKMQTKNFSVSLDSGIEAEMVKTSPEPNSLSLNHAQNSSLIKLPASVLTTGSHSTLNESESESSIVSDDSNSSEEISQIKNKGSKSTAKVTVRGRANRATSDKLVEKSKELLSISGLKAKQCGATNCASNSVNSTNKRTPSINSTSAATNTTARRPPLRKAVSISCEQELLKTGAQRRNEVNSSVNDNGKSPRPKTAASSHQPQRCYETGTNRSTHNYNHRLTSYVSPFDNRAVTANGSSSSSSSQGSKNRKILIKKALMEINQSSVNLRRKWGTLGRPRTAPNLEKNTVHHGSVSKQHPFNNPQLRPKPLKASPLPISGNGKIAVGSSGKSSSVGGKSSSEAMEGGKSEQISSPTGQLRASSEVPEENDNSQQQQHVGSSKQSMFRQCFSLDESALLGFSIKSVNEGRIPLFEKWADMASGESCSASIMDDELSFLSAKKREQCLKVYEKMKKTGCEIKLDTIFRGMLTPSEYRAFMRAAENAAQEAEEAEKAKEVSEDQEDEENAGTEQPDAYQADVKEVLNKK